MQANGILLLPKPRRDLVLNFLARFPATLAKVATPHTVAGGYATNGQWDPQTGNPSISGMMSTLRRNMRQDEEHFLIERLPLLVAEVRTNGHIPEALFQEAGFPPDLHSDGREAPRDYGITAEGRQRAKTLTHDAVKAECAAQKEAVEKARQETLQLKFAGVIDANTEEEVLRAGAAIWSSTRSQGKSFGPARCPVCIGPLVSGSPNTRPPVS